MMVETGMADVVVAGGCESMSNVEHYTTDLRGGVRMGDMMLHDRLTRGRVMSQPIERFGVITGMIETADNLAKDYGITREEADAFAVRSHRNPARSAEHTSALQSLMRISYSVFCLNNNFFFSSFYFFLFFFFFFFFFLF